MWFSSLSVYFCLKIVGLVIYGEETMDYGGKPLAGYRTQGSELLMILSNLFTFWGLNFLICKMKFLSEVAFKNPLFHLLHLKCMYYF